MVGKAKRNGLQGREIYGKLPIINHSALALGLWQPRPKKWKMIGSLEVEMMEQMVKSSEGTNFLVVGVGTESIWFLLRGSEKMLEFRHDGKQWISYDSGCPGGGYLDASFHGKALLSILTFNVRDVG